jgi:hypothetical protein
MNEYGIVRIVNGLQAAPSEVRILTGARGFSFLLNVQTGSGAHPIPRALTLGINPPGCEADLSLYTWLRKSGSIIDLLSCIVANKGYSEITVSLNMLAMNLKSS